MENGHHFKDSSHVRGMVGLMHVCMCVCVMKEDAEETRIIRNLIPGPWEGLVRALSVGYRRANLYLFICARISVYMGMRSGSKVRVKLFMTPRTTFNLNNGL